MGHNAHRIHRLPHLFSGNLNPQARRRDYAPLQRALGDGLHIIDQYIAPFFFILIARDFRASYELGGISFILLLPFEKGDPIGVKLNQDSVADFTRKRAVGIMVLESMEDFYTWQVLALMK